jgi:hypothetical protein
MKGPLRWEATRDEHTCDFCKLMHGRIVLEKQLQDMYAQGQHCTNENGCRCTMKELINELKTPRVPARSPRTGGRSKFPKRRIH